MSVATVSPQQVRELCQQGKTVEILDVRTPAEYAQAHAEGARCVPLDTLDVAALLASRNGGSAQPLFVICQSGSRAARACEKFQSAGFTSVFSVEGGTRAWEQAGMPMVRGANRVIALERQVRIAAGTLVLIGLALGWFVHPAFLGLSAFVGGGLVFAGVTDWCGMGMLLSKMPWNQRP